MRTADEYRSGYIPGAINISLQELEQKLNKIPKDKPVVVYCRSGNRSAHAAQILLAAGYADVYDLGGLFEWARQGGASSVRLSIKGGDNHAAEILLRREAGPGILPGRLRQDRRGPGGRPDARLTPYLRAAEKEGLRITHVTETHIHADFVSGSRELAAPTGATIYLSDMGDADWKYAYAETPRVLVRDGDSWMVGNIKVEVLPRPATRWNISPS